VIRFNPGPALGAFSAPLAPEAQRVHEASHCFVHDVKTGRRSAMARARSPRTPEFRVLLPRKFFTQGKFGRRVPENWRAR